MINLSKDKIQKPNHQQFKQEIIFTRLHVMVQQPIVYGKAKFLRHPLWIHRISGDSVGENFQIMCQKKSSATLKYTKIFQGLKDLRFF